MLAIRKHITDKIIAIILLIALTVSDFLFVGKSVISYALDVVKTSNTNVEFTAYFLDDKGMKVEKIEKNINNEETRLFIEVEVKNEGYFNGKISLNNNNFNIKNEIPNEYVEKVEENEVTLKQINAGSKALIELIVTPIKDEKIPYSKLFGETEILLNGEYVDGNSIEANTYIPIQGKTNVEIEWKSPEDTKMELDAKLLTNYIYKEENQSKRIVQILINSKIKDNLYPVKDTEINLNVPKKVQEVKVHTRSNSATNSNLIFNQDNYEYDETTHRLNIRISNENKENISWNKNAEDIIVVTYVLAESEKIDNPNITIHGKIQTYDEKIVTETKNIVIDTEIDGISSLDLKNQENSIYKGKLYTGETREYKTTSIINIDYANVEESIRLKENETVFLSDKNPITANISYKKIEINKKDLINIFGEEGYILVKDENGTTLANINNEIVEKSEENIIVDLPQNTKELEITTSKPKNVGILNIVNTKEILNTQYEKDTIDSLTAMRESTDFKTAKEEKEIALLNTNTEASLEVENPVISENNKEINIIATLLSNNESKDLYKNPSVTISLPKGVIATSVQYAVLYKNGLEIESGIVNNAEKSELQIKLNGDQLIYDPAGGTKIYVKILDMEIDPLLPTQMSKIEMIYTNEKTNVTNKVEKEIKIESQYGLMMYNEMSGYKDGEIGISKDKSTIYGHLDMNAGSKAVNLQTGLVNNFEQEIENVELIGKIPSNKNNSTFNSILNSIYVDSENVQVLYSSNEEATAEDNTWGAFTQDAKAYKIILGTMAPMQVVKMNVSTVIPENLSYNQVGTYTMEVTYNLNNIKQFESTQIVLATETSEDIPTQVITEKAVKTKTESGLDVNILAMAGNDVLKENDEVNEGQKIKYSVRITNNTGKDYSNVKIKAVQNNGYAWGMKQEEGYILYYKVGDYEKYDDKIVNYYREKETNESDETTVENLKNGESYEYVYEVSAYTLDNQKLNGDETYGTIYVTNENELDEKIITGRNKIKNAELQVKIYNGLNEEALWWENLERIMSLEINNITDHALKNTEVKITLSKEYQLQVTQNKLDELKLQSMFVCNEENVYLKNVEEGNNGEIVVTLNIANIEANSKESLGMELGTKRIDKPTVNSYIIINAITESKNTYTDKYEKEIIKIHNSMSASLSGTTNGTNITEDTKVNDGDIIEFVATLSNDDLENEIEMTSTLSLDESLEIQNAKIIKNNIEEDITSDIDKYTLNKNVYLNAGEKAQINVTAKVNKEFSNIIKNELEVVDAQGGTSIDKTLKFSINDIAEAGTNGEEQINNQEVVVETNENTIAQTTNNIENNSLQDEREKYTVKGTSWIDENKDGRKNENEIRIPQIKVVAIDMQNNKIVATTHTNEDGKYGFKLEEGNYAIAFYYDDEQYTLTTYKASEIAEDEDSDTITRTLEFNGDRTKVGLTDVLQVNKNIEDIDFGLKLKDIFDMKLEKYVSKITVINNEGTNTYEQKENTKLAKTEIKAKNLKDSLILVEYKIKITNIGDIDGYVKNIEDKLPLSLSFNSTMNPNWYKDGEKLINTSLVNTLIKAGETKELTLVLTKTMTESNTGLVHNTAQIASCTNSQGIEDKTENTDSADVIISVSTGTLINYVVIVLNIVILLGLASYMFVRYLRKKTL